MFHQLLHFLRTLGAEEKSPIDLRVAVAVLLLEAAHRDGEFSAEERVAIERLLIKKFALTNDECTELLASCEATSARLVQLYPYTNAISARMTPEEHIQLIEMLWEVVYADGVLDPEEDALIRRLGALIHVSDRDRVLAKQRVLARG